MIVPSMVVPRSNYSRPSYLPDVVADYGAGPSRSAAQNYIAFRNAIEDLPATGGTLLIPGYQYDINDTLVVEQRTGVNLVGVPGAVAAGTRSGSFFWWKGASGGWILNVNEANNCSFEGLGFFSNHQSAGAYTDKGVLVSNNANTITSNSLKFIRCGFARLAVGIQAGVTDANQPTNSEVVLWCPEFTSCVDGILFQGDQAANWRIHNMTGLSCGCVVRTGEMGTNNRGNFTVWGAALGNNTNDFCLPSFSFNCDLYRVTSEGATISINVDPTVADSYYRLLMEACKITSPEGGKAIVFRQGYNLTVRDSWLSGAVEIGNKFGISTGTPIVSSHDLPLRSFENCWMSAPTFVDTNKRWLYRYRDISPWGNQQSFRVADEMGNQSGPLYSMDWLGNVTP